MVTELGQHHQIGPVDLHRKVAGRCQIGVRGADYPAQQLRALLWEQTGASVWNYHWYAGHSTPQYSVLTPPAVAVLGAFAVAASASVAATYWFARLTTTLLKRIWRVPPSVDEV